MKKEEAHANGQHSNIKPNDRIRDVDADKATIEVLLKDYNEEQYPQNQDHDHNKKPKRTNRIVQLKRGRENVNQDLSLLAESSTGSENSSIQFLGIKNALQRNIFDKNKLSSSNTASERNFVASNKSMSAKPQELSEVQKMKIVQSNLQKNRHMMSNASQSQVCQEIKDAS